MSATFRTRPWLLASDRPSIATSLCAGRGLSANIPQYRHYAAKRRIDPRLRASATQVKKASLRQEASSSLTAGMMGGVKNAVNSTELAVLAPRTIIPLPVNKAPRDLRGFYNYYKEWFKQRVLDRGQILQQTLQFKEKIWHRATFKASRAGIVQAALELHAAMSNDLARGGSAERVGLQSYCVPKLARSLNAVIENRPPGKRYEWERVKLTGWPFWPRIVDHKWTEIDLGVPVSFRQAVVGIKSKQRLKELDAKGNVVSTKEMELLEYVVLWCKVDKTNRVMGDWRLYGTLKETSAEDLHHEGNLMTEMSKMFAAKKLLDRQKHLERS